MTLALIISTAFVILHGWLYLRERDRRIEAQNEVALWRSKLETLG